MLHLKNIIYINRNSYRSIYLQICDQLITLIKSGKLLPSTRLPGTRKLSEDLTLHRKTVIAAYAELEIQGWIFGINWHEMGRRGSDRAEIWGK